MKSSLPAAIPWSRFSSFVGEAIGLHYPAERWSDLARGTAAAAQTSGAEPEAFVERLLDGNAAPAELQTLARHLTIGETYFWRDSRVLEVLGTVILPGLIRERQGKDQRLRLWSAGCCTGEEAYSLAILVRQLLPDTANWRITILGTDLNETFLSKAELGVYRDWSFRGTPADFQERHFLPLPGGNWSVKPEIKELVAFSPLNLMDLDRASAAAQPAGMDVILCRNVLMYFSLAQARKTVENLHRALMPGGWLAVSPTDASPAGFDRFETQNFPGAVFHRKRTLAAPIPIPERTPRTPALSRGLPPGRVTTPPPLPPPRPRIPKQVPQDAKPEETGEVYREARIFADRGQLHEALACCDRLLGLNAVDATAHHLRATIALELGDLGSARNSLRRAIYLHPDFILAHVALGNLAARERRAREAGKHFDTALRLLARLRPESVVAGAEGMTARAIMAAISPLAERSK